MPHSDGQFGTTAGLRARRLFTLAEANRALVLVRRIIADIISDYVDLTDLQETLEAAEQAGVRHHIEDTKEQLLTTIDRVQSCARELDEIGVELKDWMLGVVGFDCRADGREVTLCWRADDVEVLFWHEVYEDYSARRPIATLPVEPVPAGQVR